MLLNKNPFRSKSTILVFLIFFLGLSLRLFKLDHAPPGLYVDEVSIGYNAYSIAKTLKDEHGAFLPFWFKAFGEYKLPGYIYTTAILFSIFGKSDFVLRLTSALAGSFSIVFIYLLAKHLFPGKKDQLNLTALCSALFFAVSPWSLQFSRAAFEANLALLFLILGIYFIVFGLKSKTSVTYLPLGVFFGVLSMATYNSNRIVFPLLGLTTFFLFRPKIKLSGTKMKLAGLATLFIILLILPSQLDPKGFQRFFYTNSLEEKPSLIAGSIITKLVSHTDPTFLFFHGDFDGKHSVRRLGMMYYFDLPLILLGLYQLTKQKKPTSFFLLSWLVIGILPATIAHPSPHALRSLNSLPPLIFLSALGLSSILKKLQTFKHRFFVKLIHLILVMVFCYNFSIYLLEYYNSYQKITALDWGDGEKEMVAVIKQNYNRVDRVFVHTQLASIYLAYYFPLPPQHFQQTNHLEIDTRKSIFEKIYYYQDTNVLKPHKDGKTFVLGPAWQQPEPDLKVHTINMINGDTKYLYWIQ